MLAVRKGKPVALAPAPAQGPEVPNHWTVAGSCRESYASTAAPSGPWDNTPSVELAYTAHFATPPAAGGVQASEGRACGEGAGSRKPHAVLARLAQTVLHCIAASGAQAPNPLQAGLR